MMSSSGEHDYFPSVSEGDSLPVVDTDASKWAAVHNALDPTARVASSSGLDSLSTVAWIVGIVLGLIWVMRNGRTVFDQWQESMHRRANRRRHGIPDEDDRPFNVAYASAAQARRQREEQEKKQRRDAERPSLYLESELARNVRDPSLRQRSLQPTGPGSSQNIQPIFLQGSSATSSRTQGRQFVSGASSGPPHSQSFTDPRAMQAYERSDRYKPGSNVSNLQEPRWDDSRLPARSSSVDPASRRHLNVDESEHAPAERRKHYQSDDTDDEDRTAKKSRVAGDEHIDGDDDAAWDAQTLGSSRRGSLRVQKRGAKRQANAEDDDDWEMSKDKRARKGSGAHATDQDGEEDISDVDMADRSSDAEAEPVRGKKREREEAESAVDSATYDTDESHRPRPARKRRAARTDESERGEPPSRGRKRERSSERSTTSDEDEENEAHPTRHKRGKRHDGPEDDGDIVPAEASESEPEIAHDPACGGRRIGDTWEVNGQSFKVGIDGRRLRHALVRRSRSKFPMPRDSAHSDAKANVDVVVEKWLNDEEYKVARENFELAWQDPSPATTPIKAQVGTTREDAAPSTGKRLLWAGPPPSPMKGHSSTRTASAAQNPFDTAPSNAGRRVASAHLLMNNPAESPKLRSSKSFSKWEKQDLEASSLKKMRARMEKQKAEEEAAKAAARPPAPIPASAPTPLMPTTNTQAQAPPSLQLKAPLSLTVSPSESPFAKPVSGAPAAQISSFSFAKPENPTASTNAQASSGPQSVTPTLSSTASPALPVSVTAKPSFSFAPAAPSSAPSETGKGTAPKPSFSFGPPPAAPQPSPIQVSSGAAKSSFSFAPTTAQTSKSDVAKSPFTFAPAPAETSKSNAAKSPFGNTPTSFSQTSPSSEPAKSAIPNFFAKPAQPMSAPASTPAPSSNSPFTFNSTQQPATNPSSSTPSFQFGPSNTSGQNNSSTSTGGGSLQSRLAPAPAQSSSNVPQSTSSQSSWPAPSAPSSTTPGAPASIWGKPTGNSPASGADTPKNVFQTPSSTPAASAFSFSKPAGPSDTSSKPAVPSFPFSKPADSPAEQAKPSFSFNFGSNSAGPSNNAPPAPNSFNTTHTPATQAQPGGFTFGFGSSSGSQANPNPNPNPNLNPFGFGTKPAEGEKK